MPWRPKQYRAPGYKTREQRTKEYDQRRGTSNERGYTGRWQKARATYLREHPLCVECERLGLGPVAAKVVDHVIPHRGDMELFWSVENWAALCVRHHNEKTARGE